MLAPSPTWQQLSLLSQTSAATAGPAFVSDQSHVSSFISILLVCGETDQRKTPKRQQQQPPNANPTQSGTQQPSVLYIVVV